MADVRLTDLQKEVIAKYQSGEFSHVTSMRVAKYCGDTLLLLALKEAHDAEGSKEEFISMMRTAITDLEELVEAMEGNPADGDQTIPLADRYAREILEGKYDKVVCIEVAGVRYVNRGQDIEQSLERPDFYSVYARIREGNGDALAHCIGDFASRKMARDYAVHVSEWGSPAWEVHEATTKGWIPLSGGVAKD